LSNNQVSLNWETVTNASGYNIKRATQPGGPYITVANNVTNNTYLDTLPLGNSTYFYVVTALSGNIEGANSNEVSIVNIADPELNLTITEDKVQIGDNFVANISLKNIHNIYAEDFTIKYDNTLFDYVGVEEVPGYKIYNNPTDTNGTLRFVMASRGKTYGINDETIFLKLKFKAKATGIGKVDATKCRLADTDHEFDLDAKGCNEDSVTVEALKDVNRSGEYTLLDLAIDGYYYGELASKADPTRYDANQVGDEYVKDEDLNYIVNKMLNNTNYAPNNS
jgi:hypothetical protein